MKASEIAAVIPGAELVGWDAEFDGICAFDEPRPGCMSWMRDGKDLPLEWVGALLIVGELPLEEVCCCVPVIVCKNPRLGFAYASQLMPTTSPTVRVADDMVAMSGPVLIGGAIVGVKGNSYEWDGDRKVRINPQAGVTIRRRVELGVGSTIVRGVLKDTVIGDDVEICNGVNVGHGARIGRGTILAPGVMVGGSAVVGERCEIWQNASIRNGVTIGDRAVIGQGASVVCDVPAGETWVGVPARRIRGRGRD